MKAITQSKGLIMPVALLAMLVMGAMFAFWQLDSDRASADSPETLADGVIQPVSKISRLRV